MNKRQVIVLWAVALVLVAVLIAVRSGKSDGFRATTERSRGETLLADFHPEQAASLRIDDGRKSVTLTKKSGEWTVADRDGYPANTRDINQLLRTLGEVKITQGVDADPSLAPRFGMDSESDEAEDRGTELVITNDGGKELAHLTFGKEVEGAANPLSPFGGGSTGRFVRNHNDESGVYITSELFSSLSTDVSRWLDDSFLKIEKIQSVQVSEPGKPDSNAWTLTRTEETADFSLEGKKDNENLDPAALNPIKNLFSYARFEDLVPAGEADEAWKSDDKRTAVIKTFEGFTYTITFGPRKSEPATEGGEAPTSDAYLMTVEVSADIPAERKKGDEESEEDAAALQKAFDERKKQLEETLADTRKLEGRVFQVTKYTIDPLLKDRTGLIQSAPPAAGGPQAGSGTPPPGPVHAVTPPIAIPSPPEE